LEDLDHRFVVLSDNERGDVLGASVAARLGVVTANGTRREHHVLEGQRFGRPRWYSKIIRGVFSPGLGAVRSFPTARVVARPEHVGHHIPKSEDRKALDAQRGVEGDYLAFCGRVTYHSVLL
jgi:hypothetical protein